MASPDEIQFRSSPLSKSEVDNLAKLLLPALKQGRPHLRDSEREILANEYAKTISSALSTPSVDIAFAKREGRGFRINIVHAVQVLMNKVSR